MRRLLATLLFTATLLAATAFAAEPAAPGPATAAPTSFARIAEDAQGRPAALQLAIVTYAPRDGAADFTIDLVSAIHVGDAAYYQGLNERFRAYDALLYEMVVSGDEHEPGAAAGPGGLGLITLMQNGLKDMLGLAFQLDEIEYDAANFVHADMSSAMLAQSMADRGESLYVYFWRAFFASLDEYARDPLGMKDWQLMTEVIASGQGDALKIALAHDLVATSFGPDIFGGENGSALIAARNEHAVSVLKEQVAAGTRRIGIFYGAAHMRDFERRLVDDLALEKTAVEWVDAWRFSK
jgi:hypothetical protein